MYAEDMRFVHPYLRGRICDLSFDRPMGHTRRIGSDGLHR
jgi:hypothetical protein